jgi:hypothetical protein
MAAASAPHASTILNPLILRRIGLSEVARRVALEAASLGPTLMAAQTRGKGLVELSNRVDALNERWDGMRRVIEQQSPIV